MAIQFVGAVGTPRILLKNLLSEINDRYPGSPYVIEAAQIVEEQSFWQWAKQHEGRITSITLDFIAPNMFGSDDEFSKEMEAFRDSERAEKVRLTVANQDGVQPDTPRMHRAVSYASKGGGRVRARAMRPGKAKNGSKVSKGDTYNSDDSVKRSFLDDVKETGAELIEVARKLSKRILGRE